MVGVYRYRNRTPSHPKVSTYLHRATLHAQEITGGHSLSFNALKLYVWFVCTCSLGGSSSKASNSTKVRM